MVVWYLMNEHSAQNSREHKVKDKLPKSISEKQKGIKPGHAMQMIDVRWWYLNEIKIKSRIKGKKPG